ncbi:MAG: SIS domain-containing protein [Oligoflexia bacterium]|nr:SIS domain-containing protein [Oligoflexia bacterium]
MQVQDVDKTQRTGGLRTHFIQNFLEETQQISRSISVEKIEAIVSALLKVRNLGGRLFFLGVGGSAGSCTHAVNDFRKLCGFEAYAPTDNVSELTARTNDEGWDTVFIEWLRTSKLNKNDAVFIMSVGGGSLDKNISPNLVKAVQYAQHIGASIMGIVGKDGGYTAKSSNTVLIIPTINPSHITPHTEAFQGIIWHLIVSHPDLKRNTTKWESTSPSA